MTHHFQPKPLACLISALLSVYAHATTVRNDVDYQLFRDLAENKGPFAAGAGAVPIHNKSGSLVGTMFDGVPVPDLKAANRNTGVAALVSQQYVSTVSHGGVGEAQFGAEDNNPDLHHFSYRNSSDHAYPRSDLNPDYKIVRLKKLVTEVAPVEMADAGTTATPYLDRSRFSHFVRVGSGRHNLQDSQGNNTQIAGSYQFLAGGTPTRLEVPSSRIVNHQGLLSATGSVYGDDYGPMATSTNPGDSGSPLFGFDRRKNRWVLVGHAQGLIGKGTLSKEFDTNLYVVSRPDFLREVEQKHQVEMHGYHPHGVYTWRAEGDKSSSLTYRGSETRRVDLADRSRANGEDHGKSIDFTGNPGVLELQTAINQGSGFLRFHNDFTVRASRPEFSWLGSGVSVASGKQVSWQVKNPQGDRLSKLGEGTLYVNGQGINEGDISIGEGKVVLAQQPDADNRKQAFHRIGLTSGRGTLTLNGENQFDPDRFYFGFRGGRLDLNGYTQSFNRIQNSDDGAMIVNHHRHHTATLNLRGEQRSERDITWQRWGQHAPDDLTLYEYTNIYQNNRKDYFRLTGNPNGYFPAEGHSNANWEYLGADKAAAVQTLLDRHTRYQSFNGYWGETDPAKPNGRLNVNYSPSTDQWLMVSGGMNLNGDVNISRGTLLLSGRPTPHAHNRPANQEVVWDHDWQNRRFKADRFHVFGDAALISGRNVERLQGDIHASGNSTLQLGFIQNQSPICIRSDHTGQTDCQLQGVLFEQDFAKLPTTDIHGHLHLRDQSRLQLGKARLQGKIFADGGTHAEFDAHSRWTMPGSSRLGNVVMHAGSEINLHPWYHSISPSQLQNGIRNFNRLTITGELSGSGRFNFLSNAAEGIGDWIDLQGNAQGSFAVGLKNTGAEPDAAAPLKLVQLDSRRDYRRFNLYLNDHFVDLGTYRYVLAKQGHEYRLYSPVRDAVGRYSPSDNSEQRRRLEQQASRQTELAVEYARQIQTKEQEAKAWQDRITAQQNIINAERQNEARHRRNAQRYWLESRRRKALEQAEQAKQKADRAQQEINRLNQNLNAHNQSVDTLRQSLSQAQQQAQTAQQQLNALNSGSPVADAGEIRRQTEQLCQHNGITAEHCNGLIKDYFAEQNAQEIEQLNRLIGEKESEKSQIRQQIRNKEQQAQNERRHAAQQSDIANKWYYSRHRRNQARQQADAASRRADALQHEADALRNRLGETDSELSRLQQNLAALGNRAVHARSISDDVELSPEAQSLLGNFTQARLLSRYANAAVSDSAARLADIRRLNQSLHAELTQAFTGSGKVWLNRNESRHRRHSDAFREYRQQNSLTRLGGETAVSDNTAVGAVFSHSRSRNRFDDGISGNAQLTMLNAYGKFRLPTDTVLSLDLGYGQTRHRLTEADNDSRFNRRLLQAGISIAHPWTAAGFDITPSAGIRYHRAGGADYALDKARIRQPSHSLTSYQIGVKVGKVWRIGDVTLTPSVEMGYTGFNRQGIKMVVNNHRLDHPTERRFLQQFALTAQTQQWLVQADMRLDQGNQRQRHTAVGLQLQYRF
ncbi:MAG: S6 family peptidase [Pasteurellaceae bacterium]|nr:S6 family peptidase [Pasteurellaceae bacterium]